MSKVRGLLGRARRAPKELIRWYLSPVGIVIGALAVIGAVAGLSGYPSVGVVALAMLLGVAIPYKFIRERGEWRSAKQGDAAEMAQVRSQIALSPTFDEMEATMKGFRRATRKSIRSMRGRLVDLEVSHSRHVKFTTANVARLDDSASNLEHLMSDLVGPVDDTAKTVSELQERIAELGSAVERLKTRQNRVLADLEEEQSAIVSDGTDKHFFLAPGYRRRSELVGNFDDTGNEDNYQREVYDYALGVAHQAGAKRVCDFGCGSGFKFMKRFSDFETTGIDVPETVKFLRSAYPDRTWQETSDLSPELFDDFDLLIAADVIEHLRDPSELLDALARSNVSNIVLSTPARELLILRGDRPLGPPANPHHYLEWTTDEFSKFVGSYLDVVVQHISNEPQATQLVHARVR